MTGDGPARMAAARLAAGVVLDDRDLQALGNPYGDTAAMYVKAGWWPLPLPHREKNPPPKDFTGSRGAVPSAAQVHRWAERKCPQNIALRLPRDVVGIDVDDGYTKDGEVKCGQSSLDELEQKFGPLPPTWSSTSRGSEDGPGPSRIMLFRVPVGTRIRSAPAPSIEAIQHHHRFMVCWPSVHPNGPMYRWYDDAGEPADRPPEVDDLADLPIAWRQGLASVGGDTVMAASPVEVSTFMATHTAVARPAALRGIKAKLAARDTGTARHDCLVTMACWTMREAAAGFFSASSGEALLWEWWQLVFDDAQRVHSSEFGDAIAWGVAQANAEPERVAAIRQGASDHLLSDLTGGSHPAGEVIGLNGATPDHLSDHPTGGPADRPFHLPPEFWSARPVLSHIQQAAHARMISPDALLHVVLARVAACSPHTLQLPPTVGGAMGLSYFAVLAGPPETGKSTAMKVGAELVPSPDHVLDMLPVGSGEGLVELLFDMVEEVDDAGKTAKVKKQVHHNAVVFIDEGTALTDLGKRQGSTILATIRSIWTHSTIGNTNASVERKRIALGSSYVYGIVVGLQPEHAGPLLDDAAAGTPQRFLWATTLDPTIPEEPVEWAGPLDWIGVEPAALDELRRRSQRGEGRLFERPLGVATEIAAEIRTSRLATMRGEGSTDPMAAHSKLARLKVAALLAILDDRIDVTVDDWALAGVISTTSTGVRESVQARVARVAEARERASIAGVVRRSAAVDSDAFTRALASSARSAARKVQQHADHKEHDGGPCVLRCLKDATASKYRKLVTLDEIIERALADGTVVTAEGGYRPGRVVA